jgi:hypothetical protein
MKRLNNPDRLDNQPSTRLRRAGHPAEADVPVPEGVIEAARRAKAGMDETTTAFLSLGNNVVRSIMIPYHEVEATIVTHRDVGPQLVFEPGRVRYRDRVEDLSGKPWEVVRAIWTAPGHRMRVADILKAVWKDPIINEDTVREHVRKARPILQKLLGNKKLDPIPCVDRGPDRTAYAIDLG